MPNRRLTFIGMCFYYSGLVKLLAWWTQRTGKHLIILNFHRASGADLRSHLLYLRRQYRILPLEAALEELNAPQTSQRAERDRRSPLVLTFDDGYRDNYTHGFALAQELQVPITIFLVPNYIESGQNFWWFEGDHLVQHAQVGEACIEGKTYHLNEPQERAALSQLVYNRSLSASSVAEREAFIRSVATALQVPPDATATNEAILPLTWEQVREMAKSDLISFGAHTMYHPVLNNLKDSLEIRYEISECREVLEQKLARSIHTFAYPLGRTEHVGDLSPLIAKQAGYRWALTTTQGHNTRHIDPYQLRRITIDIRQHWVVTAAETVGIWGFFSRLVDSVSIKRIVHNPLALLKINTKALRV